MSMSEKDEYLDASENMRTHSTMRFAHLTLFIAITAGLLNSLLSGHTPPDNMRLALKTGGLLTVVVFWMIEERVTDYFHHYRRRAVTLEKVLGYSQYTSCPQRKWFTATNAVRLLFGALAHLWVIWLFFPSLLSR